MTVFIHFSFWLQVPQQAASGQRKIRQAVLKMGVMSVFPAQGSALEVWLSSLHHLLEPITLAWFRAVVQWPKAFFFFSPPWVEFFCFASGSEGDSGAFGSFAQGHIGTSSGWIWGAHTFLRHFLWEASALFPLSGSTALTGVLGIMEVFPHTPSPKRGGSCRNSPFLWQGAVQKLYSLEMCW